MARAAVPSKSRGRVALVDGRVLRASRLRVARREQILLAARRVFARRGFHATRVADLLDATGIARGTFYLYFDGKRAIFAALLDDVLVRLRAPIHAVDVRPGAVPPRVQLQNMVRSILGAIVADRDLAFILLREAPHAEPECAARVEQFYADILAMITSALAHGCALGFLRACDLATTAACLLGSVKEVVDRRILAAPVASGLDLDALTEQLLEFSLTGLLQSASLRR
ncbi:MAG: TetR/AcrR family transcriptional regulator [Myxococcales bacterium]|nr:TetR/AcrR family transcriptional regulator [Myxococcales bacterium]